MDSILLNILISLGVAVAVALLAPALDRLAALIKNSPFQSFVVAGLSVSLVLLVLIAGRL
ncbi:hypothetical protein [Planococcus shixiaomingii]|uniref:hypothetical protein n=1 Tax=Planococcus shixiaomingii TaxID=3058393 RepID=UPI0026210141|nr:hypothetical protein [Planococcus sp. N022]WKA56811.1 hypothetical protein QWY21_19520 [Planococcus sp. N022]